MRWGAISALASASAWAALASAVLAPKEAGPLVAGASTLAGLVALACGLVAVARSPRSGLGWLGLALAVTWLGVFSGAIWWLVR